ncbi:MAG: hypothetical protein ACI8WB_002518 [Phenylobacterium sp.]|jgi:hypothetical protein
MPTGPTTGMLVIHRLDQPAKHVETVPTPLLFTLRRYKLSEITIPTAHINIAKSQKSPVNPGFYWLHQHNLPLLTTTHKRQRCQQQGK